MGISGVSINELLIILAIVILMFGTKRLATVGEDLGVALKSFRRAMNAPDPARSGGDETKNNMSR